MSAVAAEEANPRPTVRVTQARVTLSEWTKLRSVKSTLWSLAVSLLLIIGIGILVCVVFENRWTHLNPPERLHFQPLRASLVGVNFAQLAIGVLGVLVITAEYSTGSIRSTLSAVPTRLPVLWAKALVFGAVAFMITLPAVFIVFFAGQAILTGQHINITISHPGVIRALFGAALYVTVMGLFGLGLGAIVRSTAGGIAALAGIVFVLPPIIGLLPTSVSDSVTPYLPSNAGGAVWTIHPDPNTLAPWAGFGVFCAYAAAALILAAVLLLRRDA
jgi:ABC-type transport system involved in multi-copper enzyme maturation permease subunit